MKAQKVRPVVCVCEVNGTVGVVSRKDYNEASRKLWEQLRKAELRKNTHLTIRPSGLRIAVEPTFLFPARSEQLNKLLAKCFVERATFLVPDFWWHLPTEAAKKDQTEQAVSYLFQQECGVEERTDWNQMVEEVNALVARLAHKPPQFKCAVRYGSAGSILNAYREGDLDFGQAVGTLKQLQK